MFVVFIHFKSQFCVLIFKVSRKKIRRNASHRHIAGAVGCQLCEVAFLWCYTSSLWNYCVVSSLIKKCPLFASFSCFCYYWRCCYVVVAPQWNFHLMFQIILIILFWLSPTRFLVVHWENNLEIIWEPLYNLCWMGILASKRQAYRELAYSSC